MPLDSVVMAVHLHLQRNGWQTELQIIDALKGIAPKFAVERAIKNATIAEIFTTWIVHGESRCGLMNWPKQPERKYL